MSTTAANLVGLAKKYQASPEATVRRYVEISPDPLAAVFFCWKLKPTQEQNLPHADQATFFGIDSGELAWTLRKLRVQYAITNHAFDDFEMHIPRDKSTEGSGVVQRAAARNKCLDDEEYFDVGACRGRFQISAIPLYTERNDVGPNGEKNVVAVIRPLAKRHSVQGMPAGLFT